MSDEQTPTTDQAEQPAAPTADLPASPPATTAAEPSTLPDLPSEGDRQWALLTHLSTLSAFVTGIGFFAPIIMWVVKKEDSPYVDYHGKEATNFIISYTIYFAVSFVLAFLLIGFLLLPIVGIMWIVFSIIAGLKANEGEYYRYPMTIRFIK